MQLKFPVAEISAKTGYSEGQVSRLINAKIPTSSNFLNKFLESFNMEMENFTKLTVGQPEIDYEKENNSEKGTPYYDVDFTASFLEVENSQQSKPDSYVTHPFFVGCDFIVRASGQSMVKVIKHGDAIGLFKLRTGWSFYLWEKFTLLLLATDSG
ncbi:hypothetical protein UMM65_13645 [Aureibaculum sp. 2210JD6-5]|uniref:hypothetical protein n=1 Tax=Aureibaculum sp. 2210JD6-5 TaxID=3103957 RepID=UPI002AAE7F68|nr:hypothetical protein [Aureibaculum sp. 2210JD6-5]MDY7396289.1 hypothetical protein [Aureibaculum sp. 2210JD6-5]